MRCEIIAEIGQNHNGDMVLAKDLIQAAKECGADVAKFQLFDAKTLFPSKEDGNEWFDYNCETELSRDDLNSLAEICDKEGIEFMASPFDVERVSWLEEVGAKRYKIASRSIRDDAMIKAIEKTKKPVVASLGMWNEAGLPHINAHDVSFLYCVSKYPTSLEDLDFENVDFVKGPICGFSDHTIGITAPIFAMTKGAKILEKHFTIDKSLYGPDHQGSMTPEELKTIVSFRDDLVKMYKAAA